MLQILKELLKSQKQMIARKPKKMKALRYLLIAAHLKQTFY